MPNLSEFFDSTGTTLNQYKITHSDTTQETVTIDYYPSSDYVQGTQLNASNLNPIITDVNTCTSAIGNLKFVALTQTQYNNLSVKDSNTLYFIYS